MDLKSFIVQKNLAKRKIKPGYFILGGIIFLLIALPLGLYELASGDFGQTIDTTELHLPEPEAVTTISVAEEAHPDLPRLLTLTIHNGDTLDSLLHRYGVDTPTIAKLKTAANQAHYLSDLRPRQTIKLSFDKSHELESLTLGINLKRDLALQRDQDKFKAKFITKALESRLKYASATIKYSVFTAGQKERIPLNVIQQLTQIFNSEIDFGKDIQPGDRFSVIYNDYYIGDQKVKTGEILAAEFVNQGDTYKAIRYTDRSGDSAYYTPEGKSLKKGFSRYPVNFSHISSAFNLNRKHPILGYHRPHRGTDYAAPLGTPIRASGNGRIVFLGRDGGYGRVIRIQHNSEYLTLYAHMLRFQRGLKRGDYVKQGQVIGYVGQSGLADGPHVHYEFHVWGKAVNPLTVKLPLANAIEKNYVNLFKAQAKNLLAQLDLYSQAKFASNSKNPTA